MPEVGDRVQVPSKKVGQQPREGVVTGAIGSLLRVKWSTGEESTITPAVGSLIVVGKVRSKARQAAGSRGAAKATGAATAKKPTATRTAKAASKGSKSAKTSAKSGKGSAKRRK